MVLACKVNEATLRKGTMSNSFMFFDVNLNKDKNEKEKVIFIRMNRFLGLTAH